MKGLMHSFLDSPAVYALTSCLAICSFIIYRYWRRRNEDDENDEDDTND